MSPCWHLTANFDGPFAFTVKIPVGVMTAKNEAGRAFPVIFGLQGAPLLEFVDLPSYVSYDWGISV